MEPLSPVTPLAALACLATAWATAQVLGRSGRPPDERGRFAAIDGLRGFLALSVFVHHAAIWYFCIQTGAWRLPPSRLYALLGQVSVELFFMITAFLFIRKITGPALTPGAWFGLFVHRLFRLGPLYLVAMAVFFAFTAWASHWQLDEPLPRVVVELLRWLVFDLGGSPDVNRVARTGLAIAWVPWSLQYEVVFYLALPLIAVAIGRRAPIALVVACAIGIALASIELGGAGSYFIGFAGGALAAYAVNLPRLRRFAGSRAGSVAVAVLVLAVFGGFDDGYAPGAMALLAAALTLVACGCDFFGVLTRRTAFVLGEASYGLYLLHPLLLYATFRIALPRTAEGWSSPLAFWAAVVALTPLLVALATLAFRFVERPGIAAGRRIDARLQRRRTGRSRGGVEHSGTIVGTEGS